MGQELSGGDNIRVGHSEREAVTELLQSAAAEGKLTLAELDERLEAALQAKTYGDLQPLVADLSADVPRPDGLVPAASIQGPPSPGYSRDDPLLIDAGMGSEKRDGVWTLPPFIRINQGMGSVKLNCLEAKASAQLIEVEVVGGAGSTVIVLPDGWGVNVDRLAKSWGSVNIKVPREAAPGKPLLLIHGAMGMGSFKVRPPRASELRRVGRRP